MKPARNITQLKLFDFEVVPGMVFEVPKRYTQYRLWEEGKGPRPNLDPLCQHLFNMTEREFLACFEEPSGPE